MKVVLSSNIEHYKHTAIALDESKKLDRYYSCALYKERPFYYKASGKMKGWIDNRLDKDLNYKNIVSFTNQEIIYKLIRNSVIAKKVSKGKIDSRFNRIFDYRTEKSLKDYKELDVFHYVSGVGYNSAKYVKENFNCKVIVDDRAEHKNFLYELMTEEYEKLGKKFENKNFWDVDCRQDYENADYIITPSTFSKSTFIKNGIPEEKLVVIPYGCDNKLFYPMKYNRDNKFRVIYVGNVCIRKGAQYLLKAFENIRDKNIELLIIGKVEEELKEYMNNANDNIRHIDYVPNNKLNEYYAQSDVFILPSLSDSFSLATIEAMMAGLPVIVSENVGAKDFVKEGINGFIIPIRDSDSIKNKIYYLKNNISIQESIKKENMKIKDYVSWNNYYKQIQRFYNEQIKENK